MNKNYLNLRGKRDGCTLSESPKKELREGMADSIPMLPQRLHWAVEAVVEPYSKDRKEVMALMSLPYLGMMGGKARFLYRNQEVHHLGFECCLIGEQSIGKSVLTRMQDVLISKVIAEDNEIREKNDALVEESTVVGGGKPITLYGTRIMMPSTTKAQFFQNLKNLRGKRAIIVCPEIDSLNVVGNWSRDGGANERLMFDTEMGGQDAKGANGTRVRVPVAVNLVTSGTPKAVKGHYKNTEDGLVTRVGFCSFPYDMDETEDSPRSEKNLELIDKIQEILLSEEEGKVMDLPELRKQQQEWCASQKIMSDASGNPSVNTFRKRAAVMGFRAGCLLYLLDGKQMRREAMEFAQWVSDYVLYFQLKYFGEQMAESIVENDRMMRVPVYARNANTWVYNNLPETFCYRNVEDAYGMLDRKATGYRMVVSRWIKNGWVERIEEGRFRKTERGMAIVNGGKALSS